MSTKSETKAKKSGKELSVEENAAALVDTVTEEDAVKTAKSTKSSEKKSSAKKAKKESAESEVKEAKAEAKAEVKAEAKAEAEVKDEVKAAEVKPMMMKSREEIHTALYVQYLGNEIESSAVIEAVKNAFISKGGAESEIKTLEVYIKPEDNAAYYVINKDATGRVALV